MHFLDAEKIINAGKEKLLDEWLYKRYLTELPYFEEGNNMSFETYKEKLLEMSRMKNRTRKQKQQDMKEARKKAQLAIKKCDPNKDFHLEKYKKGKEVTKNGI